MLPHAHIKQTSEEHAHDEESGRHHQSPLGEEQHAHGQQSPPPQGHDYSAQYPFSDTTEYPHSIAASLAGAAEVVNGGNSARRESPESLEGNTLSEHRTEVDTDAGVRELVQQLVQQANANAIGGSPLATTPPPVRNESPEPKRRRTRAKGNSAS